jgi:hypothetical protein
MRYWVKVESQDGGTAFLLTTTDGLTKAFGDEGRAVEYGAKLIGMPLTRRTTMFNETIHYGEIEEG